ncbi:MAG: hypothetical protein ACK4JX_10350 [Flavobacterium sp.]
MPNSIINNTLSLQLTLYMILFNVCSVFADTMPPPPNPVLPPPPPGLPADNFLWILAVIGLLTGFFYLKSKPSKV